MMSLVFQMISSGKGLNAKAAASTGSSGIEGVIGTAGNGMFSQTLLQSMAGAASGMTAASKGDTAAVTLQNLLKTTVSGTTDKDGEMSSATGQELLGQLLPELTKLDEQIELNPELLAALQGWLIQVSALLSGADAKEGQAENALTALAQNPATARFAVQDELNNLAARFQQAAESGDEAAAGTALKLLNSFAAILEPYTGTGSASNETSVQSAAPQAAVVGKLQERQKENVGNNSEGTGPSKVGDLIANKSDASGSGKAPASSGDVKAAAGDLMNFKVTSTSAEGKENPKASADILSEIVADQDSTTGDSKVITAGQLMLRDGITAPLKTETPQVPVHRFAQEMTGFITGKLEIVNKGGIAEATISLFPENLGQVDVKITMQNGQLVAHFTTEHAGAKDLLENQMSQLRAALQSQGLQVEKLEVSQNNTSQQSQLFQEGRHSGAGGQGSDKRSKERKEASDDAILTAELDGEWKEWLNSERQSIRSLTGQFSAEA
ncbi:flagellar hook-length control protein FliK [Paenibacillus durus]|uniref:flagellar hook-length control protein FliK n=1 Tax=Paenibacillus durus TaxID=44251 RepID=UPI0004B15FFA|nr:flagellar hook-length control protein FliK [Paenibacillus durus]